MTEGPQPDLLLSLSPLSPGPHGSLWVCARCLLARLRTQGACPDLRSGGRRACQAALPALPHRTRAALFSCYLSQSFQPDWRRARSLLLECGAAHRAHRSPLFGVPHARERCRAPLPLPAADSNASRHGAERVGSGPSWASLEAAALDVLGRAGPGSLAGTAAQLRPRAAAILAQPNVFVYGRCAAAL